MSDFTAIRGASRTLRQLLMDHVTNDPDPQLNGVPIDLRSPKEMRDQQNAQGISLWLYRVMRDGNTLHQPPERRLADLVPRPPLPLDLYYLITPIAATPEDEQGLLGRVLQVFHDHAVLRGPDLHDSLAGTDEELRMTLETLTLEELTRVWNSLQEPYQLSVSYMAQVVAIESDHEPVRSAPVTVKTTQYAQVLDVR
jgi:Pvc16 N-terminal domain